MWHTPNVESGVKQQQAKPMRRQQAKPMRRGVAYEYYVYRINRIIAIDKQRSCGFRFENLEGFGAIYSF